MEEHKIEIPVFIRINGKVVSGFGKARLIIGVFEQSLTFQYAFHFALDYHLSIEDKIIYINFSIPVDASAFVPSTTLPDLGRINISNSSVSRFIPLNQLMLLFARGNYVFLSLRNNEDCTSFRGLNELFWDLPAEHFIRIHSSTGIAWENVLIAFDQKKSNLLAHDGKTYTISDSYHDNFFEEYNKRVKAGKFNSIALAGKSIH